jgi:hypothetical protein
LYLTSLSERAKAGILSAVILVLEILILKVINISPQKGNNLNAFAPPNCTVQGLMWMMLLVQCVKLHFCYKKKKKKKKKK